MVYFITNGKYVKIGRTLNLEDTLERLQEGSPSPLTEAARLDGGIELESKCHFVFNPYRVLGSWYDLPITFNEVSTEKITTLFKNASKGAKKLFHENSKDTIDAGMVYVNPEFASMHGITKALLIDHLFAANPRNNKVKINVTQLSVVLPLSLSTAQKGIKELVEEEQYLIKHSRSVYSFSQKFFDTFDEYSKKLLL